jgi:uncharacterized protein with HEPN domain
MRPDESFLTDIVYNADLLMGFMVGITKEAFDQDDMRKMAAEKGLERIGEAMKNISNELKQNYPDVDWSGFARMRDRTTHGYWSVDYNIVWDTVIQEIPGLRKQIAQIISQEFGPSS